MRYAIVIEKAGRNYSAYVPDLPGCVATGKDPEEVARNMTDAILLHLEELARQGKEMPQSTTSCQYVEIRHNVECLTRELKP